MHQSVVLVTTSSRSPDKMILCGSSMTDRPLYPLHLLTEYSYSMPYNIIINNPASLNEHKEVGGVSNQW